MREFTLLCTTDFAVDRHPQEQAPPECVDCCNSLQIMKMWPFKGFMVNASRGKEHKAMGEMSMRQVHYFGDESAVTQGLEMNNRLTGYVFVGDNKGRIRWRTTGKLTEPESHSMMQAVRKLVPDHNRDVDS